MPNDSRKYFQENNYINTKCIQVNVALEKKKKIVGRCLVGLLSMIHLQHLVLCLEVPVKIRYFK